MELILAMRWADAGGAAGTEAAEAAEAGRALEAEYLVKWEGLAHVHCEWLAERELEALSPRKLRNYVEKVGRAPADASDKRNWLPQRCVARREAVTGDEEVLVKWDGAGTGLPYDLATWERAYSPALLTEDGRALMAALQALSAMIKTGRTASETFHAFTPVPQLLKNVRVGDANAAMGAAAVAKAIAAAELKLGKNGRILVRKSGTEPLIRVMAEGDDSDLVRTVVDQIIEAIPRQAA